MGDFMPLSSDKFPLDVFQDCPCHARGGRRLVMAIDRRMRRFMCRPAGVITDANGERLGTAANMYSTGLDSWHWFDELGYLLGKPIEVETNEYGEVAP